MCPQRVCRPQKNRSSLKNKSLGFVPPEPLTGVSGQMITSPDPWNLCLVWHLLRLHRHPKTRNEYLRPTVITQEESWSSATLQVTISWNFIKCHENNYSVSTCAYCHIFDWLLWCIVTDCHPILKESQILHPVLIGSEGSHFIVCYCNLLYSVHRQ